VGVFVPLIVVRLFCPLNCGYLRLLREKDLKNGMNELAIERHRVLFSVALGRNLTKTEIEPLKRELIPRDEALPLLPLPCGSNPDIETFISLSPRDRAVLSILATLYRYKVQTVNVAYSGCGDSGAVDSVEIVGWAEEARVGEREVLESIVLTPFGGTLREISYARTGFGSLEDAITEFVETEATARGGNWYDNEGGGGTATIEVPEMTVRFEHYCNVENSEAIKREPAPKKRN
jgi:hypothetical protein